MSVVLRDCNIYWYKNGSNESTLDRHRRRCPICVTIRLSGPDVKTITSIVIIIFGKNTKGFWVRFRALIPD